MISHKEFAIETAKEAGELLMQNYGKMQKLEWKLKTNFKTEVDDLSDELIRRRIKQNFPNHNIFSEEQDPRNLGSEYSWVVDPLDGTLPYTYRTTDHFSVCIALVKDKIPILGVVYTPKRNELYVAQESKGAFCNGEPIGVSDEKNINHIMMGFDGGKETKSFKRSSLMPYMEKLYSPKGVMALLSSGCASVPLCLTASGKLHAYAALSLEPWDMAAAVIINREAGAKVTNMEGKEWELGDESILAANPALHTKLLRILK